MKTNMDLLIEANQRIYEVWGRLYDALELSKSPQLRSERAPLCLLEKNDT